MNELLWVATLLITFISIILCYKYLGKNGLFLWIIVATLVSNIQTVKTVFLETDIINYKYGLKESRKTILYGFLGMIIMTLFMAICLLYKPSPNDFAQESLSTIFSFNVRITIGSLVGFTVSQLIDTFLFNKLQKKYKKLWLSNNASTMICQIIDTILFSFITYLGIMDFKTIMEIMITMYAFKIIVALLDTPFMYLASKIKSNNAD